MYKRVLLKLSGEALGNDNEVFDPAMLDKICYEIKEAADLGAEIAIVVGGGNFVRGRTLSKLGVDRISADYMGMMGTVMNAIALEANLKKIGAKAKAFSALKVETCEYYNPHKSKELLKYKTICIFGGGIAQPYFSTDTTSALRASENECEVILMAKNGVDGVYSADPQIDPTATKYDELTFDEILDKNLKVIDATAASLCKDNNIKALVFDMKEAGNIKKAVSGVPIGTIIKLKEN